MDVLKMTATNLTNGLFKLSFRALGTQCVVQYRTSSVEAAKEYRSAALSWIREFENTWSRFRPDSLLCKINAAAGQHPIELTPAQDKIIQLCKYTYDFSNGLLDPTSFPLTRLWDETVKRDSLPSESELRQTLSLVGWPEVEHQTGQVYLPKKGMALEIGGFGKEYAVDQLIQLARQYDIQSALVDLGRDVATLGSPPQGDYWVVGVEDARLTDTPLYRLALSGQALATSGNGRRFRRICGKKYGHIIDSCSGQPVQNDTLSVTCLANDCLTAGILSTISCLIGGQKALSEIERHLDTHGLLQTQDKNLFSQNLHRHLLNN